MIPFAYVIDLVKVHLIDRGICFALLYSSQRPMQTRIDEEGCGAVFAAACVETL